MRLRPRLKDGGQEQVAQNGQVRRGAQGEGTQERGTQEGGHKIERMLERPSGRPTRGSQGLHKSTVVRRGARLEEVQVECQISMMHIRGSLNCEKVSSKLILSVYHDPNS